MKIEDYREIAKHINILNVAYHSNIEVVKQNGSEFSAICPFCGYKDNKRETNLKLNSMKNTYHCFKCGSSGYSVGLYAKLNFMDNKKAFKELISREFFSIDKSQFEIIPINEMADVEYRNKVYLEFLSMLKLDIDHKKYLQSLDFTDSSIENCNFKSIPDKIISRKIICSNLKRKYNLEGIPGFYMHEDFSWDFFAPDGFLIPVYDDYNNIQGLSVHLDKEFNGTEYLWFSSNNKINGTPARNWITKANIYEHTQTIILTDNLLTYNLIRQVEDRAIMAFSGVTNSYSILKELEDTNVENIVFTIRKLEDNQRLDYMIEKIFKDLLCKGYDFTYKYIENYKDILEDNFLDNIKLKVA